MHREDLFAANIVGNAANGDGLVDAAMLLGNDSAFESLVTLTAAFLDANDNTNGVTDVHLGKLGLHVLLSQSFDEVCHNYISFLL